MGSEICLLSLSDFPKQHWKRLFPQSSSRPELTQLCTEGPGHELTGLSHLTSHSALFTDRPHLLFQFVPIRGVTAGPSMCPPALQPPGLPQSHTDPCDGRFSPQGRHKVRSDLLLQADANESRAQTAGWACELLRAQSHSGSHQSPGSPSALCCSARPCQRDCKAHTASPSPLPSSPLPHRTKIYWQL